MTPWIYPTLTIAGLLIAAWGAAGNTALLHFSHRQLEIFSRLRRRRERFGQILDLHDEAAISAEILKTAGIVLFSVFAMFWLTSVASDLQVWQFAGSIIVMVLLLTVATIWLPWALTRHAAATFLLSTWPSWLVLYRLLQPLGWLGNACDVMVRRMAGKVAQHERESEALEDEIMTMVTAGQREGLLQEDAMEMIEGVFDLDDTDVADIMTPRTKVDVLPSDATWDEVLRLVVTFGHTRIPVCDAKSDRVIGILYVKDLIPELAKGADQQRRPIADLLREPVYFPKTLTLNEALQAFLQSRKHLALVADEFQGFAGVVTIEDVLEEIVGEIDDEYDETQQSEIVSLPDGAFAVAATMHLSDLNEQLGLGFPEADDVDTIGGFVVSSLGHIPAANEKVLHHNVEITVLEANPRAVERLRIAVLNESETDRP